MAGDIERRVRERAYEIWESEGRPEGRSEDHWKQARAEFSEAAAEATHNPPLQGSAEPDAAGKPKRPRAATSAAPAKVSRESGKGASPTKAAPRSRRKKPEA